MGMMFACGEPTEPTPDGGSPPSSDGSTTAAPDAGSGAIVLDRIEQSYVRHLGVGEQPIVFEWPSEVVGEVELLEVPSGSYRLGGMMLTVGSQLRTDEFPSALYSEDTRSPGSAGSLRLSYLAPGATPVELTVAIDLEVHACDTLGASFLDPDRYADGWFLLDEVGAGQSNVLDPATALPACERALADYPDVARFMLQLARCHWRMENYGRAFELSERAMNLDSTWGYAAVGGSYRDGLGVGQDLARAVELLSVGAERGHPGAQHDLGKMLRDGLGVAQDEAAAIPLIRQAAEYGFHWAQVSLGKIYRDGRGTPQDWDQARHWFEQAADQNNGHAHHDLGRIYLNGFGVAVDAPRAERHFLEAAQYEFHWSLAELGFLYRDGAPGVPADREKAIEFLTRAAAAGSRSAENALKDLQ